LLPPIALDAEIRDLFGFPIHALAMQDVVALADRAVRERRRLLVGVVNVAKLVNMRRDAPLREAVLAADVVLADGMGVVWAGRVLRQPLPERVAGVDLMFELLRTADANGYRVFCFGATEEVVQQVAGIIRGDYPGVKLVGARNGYYQPEEEVGIARSIREARPDILFVAMSPPRKELFLARWADMMEVPVCHGVGGAFDVMAGVTRRAPRGWQRLGLEWLYRALQEPVRLGPRYVLTNARFAWMLLCAVLGFGRRGRHKARAIAAGQPAPPTTLGDVKPGR
jgi:N-acetylglucosaminyldiphosphoundecaprenol N-acetyl-beta-D-mannosaminyltransferase